MKSPLSIIDTYKGRHVLFTGASGFLGKVWLAQALDQLPDVGRIYVLVRGKKGQSALDRFESMINDSYAFSSLHDKHGEGLSQYLASRVEVVAGDISGDGLGIEPAVAKL